jgi:hypothetical protein
MKLQYGIRRLVLIQSGNHRFSDFPMDKPLSIHGRNNMGKSQTINALQFLTFKSVNEMDFGSYDKTNSKSFYFKSEFSMIVTEIMVKDGVFLYGAYGKGPLHGHSYHHFVIKVPFNRDDFLDNGKQLKAEEIFERFERKGHKVYFLNRDQMKHALTGNYMAAGIPYDITLIPIREVTESRYSAFTSIYKNMLTMKKITEQDVKSLLLEVFANVLTNTSVDFLKVKAEAFREHDSLDAEIKTLKKIEKSVDKLAQQNSNKRQSALDISEIKTRLSQIHSVRMKKIPEEIEAFKGEALEISEFLKSSSSIGKKLSDEQDLASQELAHAKTALLAISNGRSRFELVTSMCGGNNDLIVAKMDEDIYALHDERSALEGQLNKAQTKTAAAIRKEITNHMASIEDRQSQYDALVNDDQWLNATGLSADERQQISKVLSDRVISLKSSKATGTAASDTQLRALVEGLRGGSFEFCGVTLDVGHFKNSASPMEAEDVLALIESSQAVVHALEKELNVVSDIEASQTRLRQLKANIDRETKDKEDFVKHLLACEREDEFEEKKAVSLEKVRLLKEKISEHIERNTQANREHDALAKRIKMLEQERINLAEACQEYFFRDAKIPFLNESFFDETSEIDADMVEEFIRDGKSQYGKYNGASQEVTALIEQISSEYSKHSGEETEEEAIKKLVDEVDTLPEKSNMLENLHGEAIVKMASALSILDKNYTRLDNEINTLNRKINGLKVSNLKSFKLKLRPNDKALDSIRTILSSEVDTTKAMDMFSTVEKNDVDPSLHRDAVRYLSEMVSQINGSLTISDLFDIAFEIVDEKGRESLFTTLDGHASNGTTMTIKVLFNASLIKYLYDPKAPVVNLPFYVDEATNIDDTNRLALINMVSDLGFNPVFASVDPITTATYSVDLVEATTAEGLLVTQDSWIRYVDKEEKKAEDQLELI